MQEPEPSAERLGVGPLDLSAQDSTTGGGGGPDAQTTSQARPRRPFQARRKERSCDSCKVRKTKCDARDDTPCSACLAAKLSCTFSSPDHEGRKIGPTRRIRELERAVEELTRKLHIAEQRQRQGQGGDIPQEGARSMASSLISASGSYSGSASEPLRGDTGSLPIDTKHVQFAPLTLTGSAESEPGPHSGLSPVPSYDRAHYSNYEDSPPHGSSDVNSIAWNPNAFGPGSAPQFIDAYKGYLQRQGIYAQNISGESGNMFERTEPAVPLLSEIVPQHGMPPFDLRYFLPARSLSGKLVEAFQTTVQNYMPIFYWPILEQKFERAWSSPIWDQDGKTVHEVFCVVMMILAVGSQLVKVEDIFPPGSGGNSPTISQERHGWKFFELARKYINLNKPIYTIEDATVLLLMSIYLDKATLPSPCWLICGAMARVCQDIGLHRQPPNGRFTPIELESRSRLFWAAYIQDKRVSIKMGRPWILRREDCDISLPATVDEEGVGTALLCLQVGGVPVGGLGEDSPELENRRMVTRRAIKTVRATIEVCNIVEKILGYNPSPGDGTEQQIRRLQHIDGRLERSWNMLPAELVNLQLNKALDLPSLRVLFITQHARLILFRHFTDVHHITETSRQKKMTGVFLKFCLDQSIRVALVTARLVYRAQLHPDFDEEFGVVTDDLCHLHLFRVAVVLLLGLNLPGSNFKQEELNVCVHALQAVARVHITGRRFLQLFKQFAGLFNHPLSQTHIPAENRTEIGQPPPGPSAGPPPPPHWEESAYPMNYNVSMPEYQEPSVHTQENFAPEALGRVGAGDWSSFYDILQWNPDFEEAFGGGSGWNF